MKSASLNSTRSLRRCFAITMACGLLPAMLPAADPQFAPPVAFPFGLVDAGYRSSFAFVDIDGDGDMDAFIGKGDGSTVFQRNTGSSTSPAFNTTPSAAFGITNPGFSDAACPDLVDIDGDGDKDAFVGFYSGQTRFFQNTGNTASPTFFAITSSAPFGIAGVGDSANPDFVDINGDGDFDVFIGEGYGNTIFRSNNGNTAAPTFPNTASSMNPFGLSHVGSHYASWDYAAPCFADIDGDGDKDAIIGSSDGNFNFFRNTGNTASPAFAAKVINPFGLSVISTFADPELVDIDGDGDLDLFAGTGSGGPFFFQNTAPVPETIPPVSSASIAATATTNTSISVSFTASDAGSGVQNTQLWVKRPGDAGFANTGLTPLTGTSGIFNYTASVGDGVYEFYTIARDNNNNVEAAPGAADDSIILDTTGPSIPGGVALVGETTTELDAVLFQINFSEPVAPTFTITDVEMIGTLSTNSNLFFGESGGDPDYVICVAMVDANENGSIGIRISGVVQDALGNTMIVPIDSPLYTIENFPKGDVSQDGVFDLNDVALLGDANLGLVTLP